MTPLPGQMALFDDIEEPPIGAPVEPAGPPQGENSPFPWHLHPSGKPNILGNYTVFHSAGESAHNQVCSAGKEDAALIIAAPRMLRDIVVSFMFDGWPSEKDVAVVARRYGVSRETVWDAVNMADSGRSEQQE